MVAWSRCTGRSTYHVNELALFPHGELTPWISRYVLRVMAEVTPNKFVAVEARQPWVIINLA
jgi:hypothetical protein